MSIARTFTVSTRRGDITFKTELNVNSALEVLCSIERPSDFVASLVDRAQKGSDRNICPMDSLSEKQQLWVLKLAQDHLDEISAAESTADADNKWARMIEIFQTVKRNGAKRMALRFGSVTIKPSKDGGVLWVTDRDKRDAEGRPLFLGRVSPAGPQRGMPDAVVATLTEAASDPLSAAMRHGHATGECSCCGLPLTNKESVRLGIGPICREKWGF